MIKKSLQEANPKLAKQWHPTKNGELTPGKVTSQSGQKVWWICRKGHEWQASIDNRSKGRGCPYCSNRIVSKDNCLQTIWPDLAKEWHPSKNGKLKPTDVVPGSGKTVWWKCRKGHEWQTVILERSKGRGCPYCSGRYAWGNNCLSIQKPELAKEWHPSKNGKLKPNNVTPNSNKKVWWQCKNGHEWEATVCNRNKGTKCPYCCNQKVSKDNNLSVINPRLAEEWHPTKNGTLTPKDVTIGCDKLVWWKCKRGHEWKALIYNRKKRGCPYCSPQTSRLELRIYTELKFFFKDILHRKSIKGFECDIYMPSLKLAIELDSYIYHKTKYKKDVEKNNIINSQKIKLLRLREQGLIKLSKTDLVYNQGENDFVIVKKLLLFILTNYCLKKRVIYRINRYLKKEVLRNEEIFRNILYKLPGPMPGFSLGDLYKELIKEWHPTKNSSLTPYDVSPHSGMEVWWKCSKGHEWQNRVSKRSRGDGCPYCSRRRVCADNCLAVTNPILAKEWNYKLNNNVTPDNIIDGSHKKAWWICNFGHEWQATISSRNTGNGCPFCRGLKVDNNNCLQTRNPKLAKEWHPTKNGDLTAKDVTLHSGKRVWWQCKKGHEWNVKISDRSTGTGCPVCRRRN